MRCAIFVRIAELIRYEPNTGEFWWLPSAVRQRRSDRRAGCVNTRGYCQIRYSGRQVFAHRLAWFIVHGKLPDGEIDHIDGNRSNNRITNLRDVPVSVNRRNAKRAANNSSGVTGVHWDKRRGRWRVNVCVEGKRKYLGMFSGIIEAERVVKAFRAANGFTERHGT